jgi:predicted AAA+ superfamily ATPase
MSTLTITLSGPASSGKSTVGRTLAKVLKEAGHFVFYTDEEVRVDIDALPTLHTLCVNLDQHGTPRRGPYQIVIDTEET